MLEKLNPAGYQKFMRAWLICSMISSKCAALFPQSLIITIYNLHKEIWDCKNSKSFKTKRSQKSLKTCHFNSTFVINWYFTDFFYQWKSTKICRKAKHDILYIFHVYLDKRGRLPKERLPQKVFAQGEFWPRKFSPRRLLSKKGPLCQGDLFFSRRCLPLWNYCVRKVHPLAKYVVWSKSADKTEIRHLVTVLREKLTCKLKSSYGIFCS